jgi:hypothetical protein
MIPLIKSGDLPAEGIYGILIQHIMRVHNISHTFGHFLSLFVVNKAVSKHSFREGHVGAEEKAGPDDNVKPKNILANYMDVGRPQSV